MKICVVLGTRPEIIKMSPVVEELERRRAKYFTLHTGQHYSFEMDKLFFKELGLPKPKYNLAVGSGLHGAQTGKMLIEIEEVLLREGPEVVLVEGDTNSVLAGALVAAKLGIKVGHVEAGLRSYDRRMPEELNRVVADHLSDYLFAPTGNAKKILLGEGIPGEKIFVTGNTIVDAVLQSVKRADKKAVLKKFDLDENGYILLTMHRQENVDDVKKLGNVIEGLRLVAKELDLPIVFPIHPRTKKRIEEFKFQDVVGDIKAIRIMDPIGFSDLLVLEDNAKFVITDSGGLQEESCILRTPCITIRENTERPETIEVGANLLVGTDPERILKGARKMVSKDPNWINPLGDGHAGEKIVGIVLDAS